MIFTVGHSTHSLEAFLALLREHRITTLADVRSVPASRYNEHFNKRALQRALHDVGIKYLFLGKELGARTEDPRCYVDGRVQYGLLAQKPEFKEGIEELFIGAFRERIAIMCTEKEPLACHRTILIARVLDGVGLQVKHIHGDKGLETHSDAMQRLRRMHGLGQPSLFDTEEEMLERALALQESEIAFAPERPTGQL